MRSLKTTVPLALACYFIFLLATIPAGFMNTLIAHYSDNTLQLANAQGTVWHGTGMLGAMEEPISWRIVIPELLIGRLHVKIMLENDTTPMDLRIAAGHIELTHFTLVLPASMLTHVAHPFQLMGPGGQLVITTAEFVIAKDYRGDMNVNWRNASSELSKLAPIGDYWLHIHGIGQQLELALDTRQGPLMLTGNGHWSKPRGLDFSGTASSKNEQLSALLNLIAKPGSDGVYLVRTGP